ncbi:MULTISPECIES: TIGR01244 family sulfur transferase [Alteromonadaceae]|uniref:TIGR01244 family sulfur transferase n=1 Tax=Alteromonadaceae TaxID=72275 RepID=UPI003106551D
MPIINLNDHFSISGELDNELLSQLVENGLTMLINVRPDNESATQINSHQWQQICRSLRIEYQHIPVKSGIYSNQQIALFKRLLEQHKGLVHCFCRSGTRAVHLWALSQKQQASFQQLQQLCSSKGYDLSAIKDYFK